MVTKRKRKSTDRTNTLCWSCKKSTNDFFRLSLVSKIRTCAGLGSRGMGMEISA